MQASFEITLRLVVVQSCGMDSELFCHQGGANPLAALLIFEDVHLLRALQAFVIPALQSRRVRSSRVVLSVYQNPIERRPKKTSHAAASAGCGQVFVIPRLLFLVRGNALWLWLERRKVLCMSL